jgi:hypothetical protein
MALLTEGDGREVVLGTLEISISACARHPGINCVPEAKFFGCPHRQDKFMVTMTTHKEFPLWDAVNYRMACERADRDLQRPENHFSTILFDEKRHAIITVAGVPSR